MKTFFVSVLVLLLAVMPAMSQSQVAGNGQSIVSSAFNVTLLNPTALTTNTLRFSFNPLFQGSFGFGSNGVGVANASQLYVVQVRLTNGALVGTNLLNLHTMAFSNAPTGIVAPTDPFGNALSILNMKVCFIQNLGVIGSPSETNILTVTIPSGAIGWTNGTSGVANFYGVIPGPPTNAATSNTCTFGTFSLGDIAYPVGATIGNSIVLSNGAAGGVITANLYFLGSTNQ